MTLKRVIGSVVNGQYQKNAPIEVTQPNEHSLHRQYVRDRMLEDYSKDVVQPYKNGQINTEYVEAWGKDEGRKIGVQDEQER